jgi:hypothetical protein
MRARTRDEMMNAWAAVSCHAEAKTAVPPHQARETRESTAAGRSVQDRLPCPAT